MRRRRTHSSRRGLSLLEILLSMAILVLAMAAIWRLVDMGTDSATEARAYIRGTRLAESKMAEVEAGVIGIEGAEGQFSDDDAAWSFTVTSQPAGPPNLYQVTVRVSRDLQGRSIEVSLSQMIFDPALIGSTAQAERPATDTGGGTSP
ncbi:MAG: prepilin-type N-terminal cleavage/methylation domain-containing protein [Gemmataceae bacterium]|nr:prepilin-type N-terminal cleavage/methylation domain-containing protein [Gemmata sp.]MDW8198776.1 prepilin-type N-terminal cleavage/methylation domain-containing protein [Gemmataceae bacterium]